jgi:hypothetical protein
MGIEVETYDVQKGIRNVITFYLTGKRVEEIKIEVAKSKSLHDHSYE